MDIVYAMPGQEHRLFINVVHACPNACHFCVDFRGERFYGFNLKRARVKSASEIIDAVRSFPRKEKVTEVYYCGIGEPLLLYDMVVESVDGVRHVLSNDTLMAINTSGTYFAYHPRVDFARKFDLVQVSLNAENREKYDAICRPKIRNAYETMMTFMRELRRWLEGEKIECRVELSVVDTSERELLPRGSEDEVVPLADIEACREIAASFGWPLKVKRLMREYDSPEWRDFAASVRGKLQIIG